MIKKVAITGGFGFIAARLADHLRQKGIEVLLLEHPKANKPEYLSDFQLIRYDITNDEVPKFMELSQCDAILHLAAQSSGPRSFNIPHDDIKINILGTLNTINLALSHNIEKILFASSFVVYGDKVGREKLSENDQCFPKSIYANSKFAAENLLRNFAEPKGINWNALRMFNVYGPGQDITKPDQGLVGIFMNMLMQSHEVNVKGRLDRFRDLIFIDDVINGWDICLHKGKKNKVYNLGSGKKIQFDELIYKISKVLNKDQELVINELDGTPGDMLGCIANIDEIKNDTAFNPETSVEEGLIKMYQSVL